MIFKNSQQDVEINIPKNYQRIGIKMSGGADSSLLCYMLAYYKATERPEIEIYPITSINSLKPWQHIVVKNVLDFCERELNIKFQPQQVSGPVHEDELGAEQARFVDLLYAEQVIECHFMGMTKNPPMHLSEEFCRATNAPRDINRDYQPGDALKRTIYGDYCAMRGRVSFQPFLNIDKAGIAELYRDLNLTDTLFPITKSCESYEGKLWNSPHCETKCWWCLERQWGFGRIL